MRSKRSANIRRWNLEGMRSKGCGLLIICPRCNQLGRLHYSKKIGWYVKHGSKRSHGINKYETITIPLHSPKLLLMHYMGGDYYLTPYIARMIPPHTTYVEVFGGGAPLLLNKPPSKVEVYNDIDGDLVNLFMVVKDRIKEFMEYFEWILYSRKIYYDFLRNYKRERDPVKRAVMYYYIIRCSFNGMIGAGFSTGANPEGKTTHKFWRRIDELKLIHERLKYVIIEQLDFRECIRRYDKEYTFFYLDPPHLFYATEKHKDYYVMNFTDSDYFDLLNILTKVKGKWLLKQNYIPAIIEWAREHEYSMRIVRMAKYSQKTIQEKGEGREGMNVVFIANYKL